MRRLSVSVLAVLMLTPVGAVAQEGRAGAPCGEGECRLSPERDRQLQAKADSLRATLDCPTDVDWPPLPAEGHRVVRTGEPDRTDVTVPQYAYFYKPGSVWGEAVCLPVIMVQAQGSTFGWIAVLEPPPAAGGAFEHFFDLLGTDRPEGSGSVGPVRAQMPEVAPEVTHVVTGGYWEAGAMAGQYRLVFWTEDSEQMRSGHQLQWIEISTDGGAPTVLASIPLEQFDAPFWTRPSFESRDGAPVFVLEQTHTDDPKRKRVVEILPGAPGEYRVGLVIEPQDL